MTRSGRVWTIRIDYRAWEAVVGGTDGQPPLIEYVHARINRAMHARGYVWHKGRWSTAVELREALAKVEGEKA